MNRCECVELNFISLGEDEALERCHRFSLILLRGAYRLSLREANQQTELEELLETGEKHEGK